MVWLLQNVPKFEQGAFRTLGLHDAVLRLFDSPSADARKYAANYARTHARDLPVSELIRLANNDNEDVRKLATDLLGEKDPRTGVGLEILEQGLSLDLAGLGLLGEGVDAVGDLVAPVGDDALLARVVELGLHVGRGLADELDGVVARADVGVERLGGGLENSGLSHQCFLLPVWDSPLGTIGRRR